MPEIRGRARCCSIRVRLVIGQTEVRYKSLKEQQRQETGRGRMLDHLGDRVFVRLTRNLDDLLDAV